MKRPNLENIFTNSKFAFCKHFWKFVIAPVALIILSIVLAFTIGFNAGFDFTGGTTITVYSNNDNKIVGANNYDLQKAEDYKAFIKVLDEALEENDLTSISYQKTTVTIYDLPVVDGDAVVLKVQGASQQEISALKDSLVEKLGYDVVANGENAVVEGKLNPSITQGMLNLIIAALLVAVALIFVYLCFRQGLSSAFAVILGLAHDVLLMLCFALIFRIKVEAWFLAGLVVLMMFSFINNIFLFGTIAKNVKNGKFEENGKYSRKYNNEVANLSIKESLTRQTIFAIVVMITLCLVALLASSGVRTATFPLILGVIASIYSSIFLLAPLWAMSYIPPKKKHAKIKKDKEEYEV